MVAFCQFGSVLGNIVVCDRGFLGDLDGGLGEDLVSPVHEHLRGHIDRERFSTPGDGDDLSTGGWLIIAPGLRSADWPASGRGLHPR